MSMYTVWLLHSKWLSNESASNFMSSLNIHWQKLFGWFRRLQFWAASEWQLHHNNTPTHASHLMQRFLAKHQITQVTQPPYSPDLAPCNFWLFPKLKSPLKGKRFQTVDKIQENTTGQLMAIGRTVWGPKGAYFEGDWGVIVLCTMFLVSSSVKVSILHLHVAGCLLDRPCTHINPIY